MSSPMTLEDALSTLAKAVEALGPPFETNPLAMAGQVLYEEIERLKELVKTTLPLSGEKLTEVRRLAEKHGAWERVGLSLLPGKELRALVCELDCDKGLLEDAAALLSAVPGLLAECDRLKELIKPIESTGICTVPAGMTLRVSLPISFEVGPDANCGTIILATEELQPITEKGDS